MATLSKAELDRFLERSDIIATLASLDETKAPYQVPVWYEWDGQYLWIVTKPRAHYVTHLLRDPRVAVSIARAKLPYVRVLIQGTAKLLPTDLEWLPMGHRMARRYLGKTRGTAYIEKTKHWKRVYIRVKPTAILSWDGGVSGHEWGKRYVEDDDRSAAQTTRGRAPRTRTRGK
jgi:PPOX class probable F420-dependent enzyme